MYENKGEDLELSLELTMTKERWRANFGRALASVGDIDLDGYQGMANIPWRLLDVIR